jgi:hypothetical protein
MLFRNDDATGNVLFYFVAQQTNWRLDRLIVEDYTHTLHTHTHTHTHTQSKPIFTSFRSYVIENIPSHTTNLIHLTQDKYLYTTRYLPIGIRILLTYSNYPTAQIHGVISVGSDKLFVR